MLDLFVLYVGVLHAGNTYDQDPYQAVTVWTHGNFVVLPHWESRLLTPCLYIQLSHIILTLSQPGLVLSE